MSKIDVILSGPDALDGTGSLMKGEPKIHGVSTILRFHVADLPALGTLTLKSQSWAFASQLAEDEVKQRLEEIGGPARATLEEKEVAFRAKNGDRAGDEVRYSHPVLTILGPALPGQAPESDAGDGV